MSRGLLLGIDLGTTVLKVCVFDARSGAVEARATQRLKLDARSHGEREQQPASVHRAFRSAVAELRRLLGARWSGITGIGLAAQGGSTIIADRATGRALTPMYLWNDARGASRLAEVLKMFPAKFWRRFALRDLPPAGLGRLLWLRDAAPALFSDANIHVGAGEYLFFRLTGVWRQDAGNAIQIGAYNARNQRLDATPFELVDVPLTFVAPLRRGHETSPLSREGAAQLGLSEGIPVAGPYIDQEAGYLSAAAAKGQPLQCSLGTAWVGNFVLPPGSTGGSPYQLPLPSPLGEGRLVVQPLLTGNSTWDWALQALLDRSLQKALKASTAIFEKALLPPYGLFTVPWMAQPNPRLPEAFGGGAFWGVSSETQTPDLLRAVASGMVFELVRVLRPVTEAGVVDGVVLAGGASKGAHFGTLAAALFAPLSVHRQTDEDLAAARGALYAFGGKACRGQIERVPLPGRPLRHDIQRAFDGYSFIFESLYGGVPQGQPFKMGDPT